MIIEQANEKLLKELESNDNKAIDTVHVWLNQNITEEIATGILKEEKTIQEAYKYVHNQAKEQAGKSSSIMIEDDVVFGWITEFYTSDDIKVEKTVKPKTKEVKQDIVPSKTVTKKSKKKAESFYEQLELF